MSADSARPISRWKAAGKHIISSLEQDGKVGPSRDSFFSNWSDIGSQRSSVKEVATILQQNASIRKSTREKLLLEEEISHREGFDVDELCLSMLHSIRDVSEEEQAELRAALVDIFALPPASLDTLQAQADAYLPRETLTHQLDVMEVTLPRIMPELVEVGGECKCSFEVVGGNRVKHNKLAARPRLRGEVMVQTHSVPVATMAQWSPSLEVFVPRDACLQLEVWHLDPDFVATAEKAADSAATVPPSIDTVSPENFDLLDHSANKPLPAHPKNKARRKSKAVADNFKARKSLAARFLRAYMLIAMLTNRMHKYSAGSYPAFLYTARNKTPTQKQKKKTTPGIYTGWPIICLPGDDFRESE
eukprot:TRINITY_DN12308_c2_g2_i2.p1 TRINITY_DN12308_c2_g2~~TRINITY_DN12308_c2_g2_i2.p1  ORF type:complete len:361 (+),score=80.93 TRINITY_DN12308_c2_g2_i2:73-1155(+)